MSTKQQNQFKEETEEKPLFFGLFGTEHVHTLTNRKTGEVTKGTSLDTPKEARDKAWDKIFQKDK
ncbi:hypothetical protein [Mucilaginibacter rubeus]|uniref:Uncharacterized protein n=1 Tax=Mucilaginibacter rubeus TaxID=2027860 RepID=A0A5C1I4S2_9SPHI|nr:hypothetical protein [Mucilaginibacter rubeus]QEM12963.1 hypothetical protein DEO27_024105 [Mucilaginibacter rubeus]